jgi:molybdopterin-containing oxidoreductase family iron-sulfur binding subunit
MGAPPHGPAIGDASDAVRRRLEGRRGRAFWRSLEELADAPDFRRLVEAEFPSLTGRLDWARRDVLKALGAAVALAGLAGCAPDERAVPYVEAPEFLIPGRPKYYATAALLNGYAQPVLGETHVGRPTKLEGNPDHPASGGATDAFTQAAVLGLYDPDRSRAPRYLGRPTSWNAFDTAMVAEARRLDASGGDGFRLLTGAVTSPTLIRQIEALERRWPKARRHAFEPVDEELRLEATARAFGRPLEPRLRLDLAEVTISLDDDVLGPGPKQTWRARLWSRRRQAAQKGEGACILHVAEPTPSLTGVAASRRLIAASARIGSLAEGLAAALGLGAGPASPLSAAEEAWIEASARALRDARGRSLVTVGAQHDPGVQALGLLINERLGNLERTVTFTEPLAARPPDGARSLARLADDMRRGRVSALAVLEANPVYAAPADLGFGDLLDRVALRIHAGLHADETAALCHWHAPLLHELDSWGDARAADGLVTILQPLVRPFFDGRSRHVVLQNLLGDLGASDYALVRETWQAAWGAAFEERWSEALVRGFVADSAPPEVTPAVAEAVPPRPGRTPAADGLVVLFRPDPSIWDGRFANIAWLQELPKPLSKVTWDNVVLVSPELAAAHGIETEDEVRLTLDGRSVLGPAWVMPGQEELSVTVHLGYGRGPLGRVMEGAGYDAYRLRTSERPWQAAGATLAKTGRRWPLASTQTHFAMDGYDFVRTMRRSEAAGAPPQDRPKPAEARAPTFYPTYDYDGPSWGMSIDLDLCIGCNACVAACVAENNIPTVGKEQVGKGRAMHWLRIDRYYEGEPRDPQTYFQPVPCMHCEKAPCEMGCPVNAATHSPDGLNQQVYNRCIGTRTCSSYCPYKVRRFNWFDLTGSDPPELRAVRNPDVTVRGRGVMEKCTYCVQRISAARVAAKIEGRPIRDGEVRTACQQACPTDAIVFGDVKDPSTAVSRRKASARDYSLLGEVNTWPRTTYLARIDDDGPGGG